MTTRVFVPETSEVRVAFLSPRQMRLARIVALVLVPAIFVHSVPRAYADEMLGATDVSAPVEVVAAPEVPSEESVPSEAAPILPTVEETVQGETAPVESIDVPIGESPAVVVVDNESTPPAVAEENVVVVPDVLLSSSTALSAEIPAATTGEPETVTPSSVVTSETASGETATTSPETSATEENAGASTPDTVTPATPTSMTASEGAATTAEVPPSTGTPTVVETPGFIERIADALGVGGQETSTTTVQDREHVASAPVPIEGAGGVTGRTTDTIETIGTTTDVQVVATSSEAIESVTGLVVKTEQQEELLRQELRKQVEEEFLRGCISFEASGYYCLNPDAAPSEVKVPTKVQTTVESLQGSAGNKEIFVIKNGARIALTSTDFDNAFPSQDISGEQFVWQGMKGGRWQIFFGTLSKTGTPVSTQVTDSRESNFNPKIDGDHLVWQGWVDENWEIFLATKRDARSPFAGEHLPEGNALLGVGPEWSVERLTTNTAPDMFPALHGDIITWQAHEDESWVVYAYSMKERTQIKLSSDGTKSENPRFGITWEERDGEGGVRLMSYDMSTGEKTNLTDEAKKVSDHPFRERFPAPISQPDQATLPGTATSTGTSTSARGDDDTGGPHLLTP
jgi:beta propeller repeat protein